jgi:hypothetical protein
MRPTLDTACMLYFNPDIGNEGLNEDVRQRLADRHRWVWLKTGHEVLASRPDLDVPTSFARVGAIVADLKARNPAVRVGMYVGGIASPDSHHPHYGWATGADWIYANPWQPVAINPTHSPALGGERRVRSINYQDAGTRARHAQHWLAFCRQWGLDGICFDHWNPEHYAGWMAQSSTDGGFGLVDGGMSGAFHTTQWWFDALAQFSEHLRWTLAQDGREVWGNGLNARSHDPTNVSHQIVGPGFTNCAPFLSGMLSEVAHVMHRSVAELRANLDVAAIVNRMGRPSFWLFQPYTFTYEPTFWPWLSNLNEIGMRRYFLACYLLFQTPPFTYFGFHDGINYQGYTSPAPHQPHLYDGGEDWDRDFGVPLGPVQWSGELAWRHYTRGFVVVNATDGYRQFYVPGTYRDWHPQQGGLVEMPVGSVGMNVPPKSGLFLWPQ